RFVWWYPVLSDVWSNALVLVGLLFAHSRLPAMGRTLGLSIIAPLSVLFREYTLLIPLAALFSMSTPLPEDQNCNGWFRSSWLALRRNMPWGLLPLAGSIGVWYWVQRWGVHVTPPEYSFLDTIRNAFDYGRFERWLLGFFATFGPVLALLSVRSSKWLSFLRDAPSMWIAMVGFLFLSFIGGFDEERFLVWSLPVALLILGKAWEANAPYLRMPVVIALLGFQAISHRLF